MIISTDIHVVKNEDGVFFLPQERVKTLVRLNGKFCSYKTWGEFECQERKDVFDRCLERVFRFRGFYDMVGFLDGDRTNSFYYANQSEGFDLYCLGYYINALYEFADSGKDLDEWIPKSALDVSSDSLSLLPYSGGIYFSKDKMIVEEVVKKLNETGFKCAKESYELSWILSSILRSSREEVLQKKKIIAERKAGYPIHYRDLVLHHYYPSRWDPNPITNAFKQIITNPKENDAEKGITTIFSENLRSIIPDIILNHGYFSFSYFRRKYYKEIVNELVQAGADKIASCSTNCDNLVQWLRGDNHDKVNRDIYGEIAGIAEEVVERELLRTVAQKQGDKALRDWIKRADSLRSCKICSKKFRLSQLTQGIYVGSDGIQECCFLCDVIEFPTRKELPQLIRNFVNACGFLPESDAGPANLSFMRRISKERWIEVLLSYARMGRTKHVSKTYGTWLHGLAEAGLLANVLKITPRGVRCLADDGHLCLSLAEQIIDNWLYKNRIAHEREPRYPYHPKLNPGSDRRADWLINDIYVEYFGLTGDRDYDFRTAEKISLCKDIGARLVSIYPWDIVNLDRILGDFCLKA